jgi:hypothetical protein
MPLSPVATAIKKLGLSLFGENWRGEFARMVGLDRSYITLIANGDRSVTQTVMVAVITGLRAEVKKHQLRANEIDTLAVSFEKFAFGSGRKLPPK